MINFNQSKDMIAAEAELLINSYLSQKGWNPRVGQPVQKIQVQISNWRCNQVSPIWYDYIFAERALKLYIDDPFAHVIGQNKFILLSIGEQFHGWLTCQNLRFFERLKWKRGVNTRWDTSTRRIADSIKDICINPLNYGIPVLPSSVGYGGFTSSSVNISVGGIVDGYVIPNWYPLLEDMLNANRHIQLMGPPGVGKSRGIVHLAKEKEKKLFVTNCHGRVGAAHLEGTRELRGGNTEFKRAEFAEAAINGDWVLLEESNYLEPDASIMLNGIIEDPHTITLDGKALPVHKDFRLFMTYNPDFTGTKRLPESLEDRLFPIYVPHPTEQELLKILSTKGLDPKICNILTKFASEVWSLYSSRSIRYALSIRRLEDAGELLKSRKYSFKEAVSRSIFPLVRVPTDRQNIETIIEKLINS